MPKHSISPVFGKDSKLLILGSFPSVKSRETQFFYGHPQNRFWRVIAYILGCDLPNTIDEKRSMLLENKIALWDVIASCDIEGSDDASITNVVANDLSCILETSNIKRIFTNGGKADALYKKYCYPKTGIVAVKLPSTSPANAQYSLERLISMWSVITENR